jgi:peroxiredoxin
MPIALFVGADTDPRRHRMTLEAPVSTPLALHAATALTAFLYLSPEGVPRVTDLPDTRSPMAVGATAPEPGTAVVEIGDRAPDFAFTDLQGRTAHLHDLLAQGAVLLVFESGESGLSALQRERDALVRMGVVPVAIEDMRSGAARSMRERLALSFPVIPDTRAIAASQFNSLDGATLRPVPSWFVVDRAGHVRGLKRGAMPAGPWAPVVATALGLPSPEAPHAASTGR